jgi:hypothetical protein
MSDSPAGDRRVFDRLPGGGYAYTLIDDGIRIEVRYVRRQFHQVYGEVDVLCDWASAQSYEGSISRSDLNLSSQKARRELADHCKRRAKSQDYDWLQPIDAASLKVIGAERSGEQPIVLDDAPALAPPQDFDVLGLKIPADSHSMIVADGGGLKSLILLLVLGMMALAGLPVLYLDWEWQPARHLARKRRLFGDARLEHLHYLTCRQPLAIEADHIRLFCSTHGIQFLGIDSISAACDGKLADDDVARAYNRALADLPPSLSAAHIPKNALDPKADPKAFGSAFFHNFTRCSWSVKKQTGSDEDVVTVGLFPVKQNDGARARPVGLEFSFAPDLIRVRPVDLAQVDGLADSLPVWQRMRAALNQGPRTLAALAEDLGEKVDTVDRTVRRKSQLFTKVSSTDGITRIALVERRAS